jgi:hypothetical protein
LKGQLGEQSWNCGVKIDLSHCPNRKCIRPTQILVWRMGKNNNITMTQFYFPKMIYYRILL